MAEPLNREGFRPPKRSARFGASGETGAAFPRRPRLLVIDRRMLAEDLEEVLAHARRRLSRLVLDRSG